MNKILQGDCLTTLRTLADESVHCVITSPPYWGLRDYGVAGQLGLEKSPDKFVAAMVAVFSEVKRVLRSDGTLWLNIGDSYAGSWGAQSRENGNDLKSTIGKSTKSRLSALQIKAHPKGTNTGSLKNTPGIKAKDLVGIPWMLAFALRADGWYLRQDIIWSKPNPMPESVQDRCTKAHEYIFMLSKSKTYHYNAAAIRTDPLESTVARLSQNIADQRGSDRVPGKTNGPMKAVGGWHQHRPQTPQGIADKKNALKDLPGSGNKLGAYRDKQRGHGRRHDGFNDRWDAQEKSQQQIGGANKRSVWQVATMPFKEAHFATFPEKLIEPMVLAGCPTGGVVLDPFMGAGTTGLVAKKLGRQYLGIELNPAYIKIAEKRIGNVPTPMF